MDPTGIKDPQLPDRQLWQENQTFMKQTEKHKYFVYECFA